MRRGPLVGTLSLLSYLNHLSCATFPSLRSGFRNLQNTVDSSVHKQSGTQSRDIRGFSIIIIIIIIIIDDKSTMHMRMMLN
jgi:hypothetical protein